MQSVTLLVRGCRDGGVWCGRAGNTRSWNGRKLPEIVGVLLGVDVVGQVIEAYSGLQPNLSADSPDDRFQRLRALLVLIEHEDDLRRRVGEQLDAVRCPPERRRLGGFHGEHHSCVEVLVASVDTVDQQACKTGVPWPQRPFDSAPRLLEQLVFVEAIADTDSDPVQASAADSVGDGAGDAPLEMVRQLFDPCERRCVARELCHDGRTCVVDVRRARPLTAPPFPLVFFRAPFGLGFGQGFLNC
jgi:hypothetical protein